MNDRVQVNEVTLLCLCITTSPFGRMLLVAPDPKWPNRAKVALQFVINYEEGAENCLLHGDKASESLLSEIIGVPPYQGERHTNMESLYDYGSRLGV